MRGDDGDCSAGAEYGECSHSAGARRGRGDCATFLKAACGAGTTSTCGQYEVTS